ncbi:FeoA family protein [Accumulibacter sp.]|uniref:FeoA family protein n=1 Tax=Accumulibacter sp. TaxID=2053492 RepID=UPI002622B7F0|nr:FeoA family protein [Accumulibacter sp.]
MNSTDLITLFELPTGQEATVGSRPLAADGEKSDRELSLRLFEIGFIDGERVCVVARGHPGGDPVAVRVGNTMFALRRFEAERVLVAPLGGVA